MHPLDPVHPLWYWPSLYRCLPLVADALVLTPSVTGYWRRLCHFLSLSLALSVTGYWRCASHHQRGTHIIRGVSLIVSRASGEALCLSRSDRSQG